MIAVICKVTQIGIFFLPYTYISIRSDNDVSDYLKYRSLLTKERLMSLQGKD